MATYQDGGVRKATPNTVASAKRSAENRRCPACNRKSAMQFHSDDFGFGSTCRWCGHSSAVSAPASTPASSAGTTAPGPASG